MKTSKKQQIVAVAMQLFAENGYHNTSMDSIANACQLKKPSLYHYIVSRENLLLTVLKTLQQRFAEQVLPIDDMEGFVSALDKFIYEQQGHLMIKLVFELNDTIFEANHIIKQMMSDWRTSLFSKLNQQHDTQDAQCQAEQWLAKYVGKVVLSKMA